MGTRARQEFAERFALLYAEAGEPALKQVVESVTRARRTDQMGRPLRVSVQRVSDWRRGRNVPARFGPLAVVLETLIGQARKRRSRPVAEGLYDQAAWRRRWEQALTEPVEAEPSEAAPTDGVCPYPGLAAYGADQADWFFGRDRATADLLEQLAVTGGPVIVVGASGAGKSSLLRAGLVPALAAGRLPGSADWPVRLFTPGPDPIHALAVAVPELAAALDAEPDRVQAALPASTVLVVDQFEEVFTLCEDAAQRDRFLRVLGALSAGPTLVVLGLRADFYAHCLGHPALVEALRDRQCLLGPMNVTEIREAVTGPARAVGLKLENGLEELLLRDLGVRGGAADSDAYDPGALPLLSHALLATWQRRSGGRLTVAGYRAAGGISGSVAAAAERAWAGLDTEGQAATRELLLRLVRVGEDGQDTRRTVPRTALLDAVADPDGAEDALEVLARARLVTLDDGSVQVTHEALLRVWPRLRGWIDQDRAGALARQEIEEDATAWAAAGRDRSLLYRGNRLYAAGQVAGGTGLSGEFLAAAQRQHRRARWAWRAAVAGVTAFALVAAVSAAVAVRQRDTVVFEQVMGAAERLRESDPSLSAQLNLVAHRLRPEDRGVQLRMALTQHAPLAQAINGLSGLQTAAELSGDGSRAVTVVGQGRLNLWGLDGPGRSVTGSQLLDVGPKRISSQFSHNGHLLAVMERSLVQLWNTKVVSKPRRVAVLATQPDSLDVRASFSRDGSTLVVSSGKKDLDVWNVTDPARPSRIGKTLVLNPEVEIVSGAVSKEYGAAALSSDGTLLATFTGRVQLRKVKGSEDFPVIWESKITEKSIVWLSFDPKGKVLAVGGYGEEAQVLDLESLQRGVVSNRFLAGYDGGDMVFSPDGSLLASNVSSSIKVWRVSRSGLRLREYCTFPVVNPGHISFADGGKHLTVFSGGKRILVFRTDLGDSFPGLKEVAFHALSPSGRFVVTGEKNGGILLWSIEGDGSIRRRGRVSEFWGEEMISFNDKHLIVAGGLGGVSRRWNIENLDRPAVVNLPSVAGRSASLSSTGRFLILSGDANEPCEIFDFDSLERLEVACQSSRGQGPVFSGKDNVMAIGVPGDKVAFWDVSNIKKPNRLSLIPGDVWHALSNSNGSLFLVNKNDGSGDFWGFKGSREVRLSGNFQQNGVASFVKMKKELLLTQGVDGIGSLWGFAGPDEPLLLSKIEANGTNLILALDGKTVLGFANHPSVLHFWDISDPTQPVTLTSMRDVFSAKLSPDGKSLVTESAAGIEAWDLDPTHAVTRICASTPGILTPEKWAQHVPGLPYDPPCEADRAAA